MKVGAFTIQCDLIDNQPGLVLRVLNGCIVVRAETIYHTKEIAYIAIAEHFEDVPVGGQVPEYDIEISGHGKVKFIKKGKCMRETKRVERIDTDIIAITCDKCKRRIASDNMLEFQEVHGIEFYGGYSSVFGDGAHISLDFCDQCLLDLVRPYLKDDSGDEESA